MGQSRIFGDSNGKKVKKSWKMSRIHGNAGLDVFPDLKSSQNDRENGHGAALSGPDPGCHQGDQHGHRDDGHLHTSSRAVSNRK